MRQCEVLSNNLYSFVRANLTWVLVAVAAIILFVVLDYCIGYSAPRDDVINFYNHAESMKAGLIPYKDFEFEFPPFSLIFFLIPGLFTSDLNTYAALFGVEVVVFTLLGLYYLLKICEKTKVNRVLVTVVLLVLVIIYFTDMMKKFDVMPMAFTIASLYYFIQRRFGPAYALIMFAALIKIYPALILVVYIVINCLEHAEYRRRNVMQGVIAAVVVGLVAVVPLMMMSVPFSDIMSFVTFHTDRGFQVESVAGVIIQALGLLGLTSFSIVGAHYTWDVAGPLSDAILPYWNFVYISAIVATIILIAIYVVRSRDEVECGWNARSLMAMAMLITLVFILTNKVFSTQYMIWIFPFLAFLPFTSNNWKMAVAVAVLFIIAECCARGILFYSPGETMFVFFNLLRDAILILIAVSLVRFLVGDGGCVARQFMLRSESP